MTRTTQIPGFFEGVMVAAVLSIAGGSLHVLLRVVAAPLEARTLTIAAIGFGYLLYLLWRSPEVVGRISLVLLWSGVTVPVLLLAPQWTLVLQLTLLWLTRALFLQHGFGAALADLLLVVVGLGGGLWAVGATGSLAAALWTFFLVQAPFSAVGGMLSRTRSSGASDTSNDDPFGRAERSASQSLRRLGQLSGVRHARN